MSAQKLVERCQAGSSSLDHHGGVSTYPACCCTLTKGECDSGPWSWRDLAALDEVTLIPAQARTSASQVFPPPTQVSFHIGYQVLAHCVTSALGLRGGTFTSVLSQPQYFLPTLY